MAMHRIGVTFASLFCVASFATPGHAQPDSRICGFVAKDNHISISYEARKPDSSYSQQCDEAEKQAADQIKKNPQLNTLKWTKTHKWTCEDVGKFVVASGSTDICDHMEAHCAYFIQLDPASKKTIYTKQKCK